MEHSINYEKVKKYYLMKMWDIVRVGNAVTKSWITAEEFKEITGEDYK